MGCLFYGETIDNYRGAKTLTNRQIYSISKVISLMQEYVTDNGAQFYFTIAPNKVSLYPLLADIAYDENKSQNIKRLRKYLEKDINYIDLFDEFRKKNEMLYYELDSHWNNKGTALAHDVIMNAMNREHKNMFDANVQKLYEHRGDLYEMLYPRGHKLEQDKSYEEELTFEYAKKFKSGHDLQIITKNSGKKDILLMYRDSFGNSLHRFMAQEFASSTFKRYIPYDMINMKNLKPDVVMVEIVERNIDYLLTKPPIILAKKRQISDISSGEYKVTLSKEIQEGYTKISGVIEGNVDDDSPIYLLVDGEYYEAMPAMDEYGINAFVAYFDSDVECYDAVYKKDGKLLKSI